MFNEARTSWFSGEWPKSSERGYDACGMEVLFFLAMARDMGLDDADIPALRAYLADRNYGRAQERFYAHWEAADWATRERLGARDDYYGPRPADGIEDSELTMPDPEDRRLHRLVRTDPEAAWADIHARLCASRPRDELFLQDLIEDLMYHDPDAFIDRLEVLISECPLAREPVAAAYVGGRASSPGLERFWLLQEQLGRRG